MSKKTYKKGQKSYQPEERLGIYKIAKTKNSILVVIDDLQLARGQKGELEKWWRIPLSGITKVLGGDQPYGNIYVSKISPTAPVKAELEDEERIAQFEEEVEEEEE